MSYYLLSVLFISSISAFPLDLDRNETCDTLKDRFMQQFEKAVHGSNLYQGLAAHLAPKCRRVLACEKQGKTSTSFIQLSLVPHIQFSEKICKLLDLINSPVGECLDYIRDEYDDREVMQCVKQQKPIDSLRDVEETDMDSAIHAIIKFETSCDSLFNNCTQSIIQSECDQSVLDTLEKNRDLLFSLNCAGTQIYDLGEAQFHEAMHDMIMKKMTEKGLLDDPRDGKVEDFARDGSLDEKSDEKMDIDELVEKKMKNKKTSNKIVVNDESREASDNDSDSVETTHRKSYKSSDLDY